MSSTRMAFDDSRARRESVQLARPAIDAIEESSPVVRGPRIRQHPTTEPDQLALTAPPRNSRAAATSTLAPYPIAFSSTSKSPRNRTEDVGHPGSAHPEAGQDARNRVQERGEVLTSHALSCLLHLVLGPEGGGDRQAEMVGRLPSLTAGGTPRTYSTSTSAR